MDTMDEESNPKRIENLQAQLAELEMLQSVFYNPGEIRVDDSIALGHVEKFVNGEISTIPPFLDITINLLLNGEKFEFCFNLSHEYPDVEPDIYVRNSKLNRTQHAKLNKDLCDYVANLQRGDPCIFSAISWLKDNFEDYVESEPETVANEAPNKTLVRYWIYSHHIYSKTKRREILNLADMLNINGFLMPGKPGIICIEGTASDCNEWWHNIKSMNWKRIFCKITEDCKDDSDTFTKFDTFEEKVFQNNSIKCNHMDMGELHKFLEQRHCGYVFKDLFGVDTKANT